MKTVLVRKDPEGNTRFFFRNEADANQAKAVISTAFDGLDWKEGHNLRLGVESSRVASRITDRLTNNGWHIDYQSPVRAKDDISHVWIKQDIQPNTIQLIFIHGIEDERKAAFTQSFYEDIVQHELRCRNIAGTKVKGGEIRPFLIAGREEKERIKTIIYDVVGLGIVDGIETIERIHAKRNTERHPAYNPHHNVPPPSDNRPTGEPPIAMAYAVPAHERFDPTIAATAIKAAANTYDIKLKRNPSWGRGIMSYLQEAAVENTNFTNSVDNNDIASAVQKIARDTPSMQPNVLNIINIAQNIAAGRQTTTIVEGVSRESTLGQQEKRR